MRAFILTSVLAVSLGLQFASGQVLSIVDVSKAGSPLSQAGSAIVKQASFDREVAMSSEEHWTVKNTSQKAIVSLIESVSVQYPSGHKDRRLEQYELFFHLDVLAPERVYRSTERIPAQS